MSSRYKSILAHRASADPEPRPTPEPAPDPPAPPPATPAPLPPPSPTPRRGRPKGKRSDPSYIQVTAYVPAELHYNIKLALLQERQGREFSDLVATLLETWLNARG